MSTPTAPHAIDDAVAIYIYNQTQVPQEVILPGGEVRRGSPLHSNPPPGEQENPRFFYQVQAWYDDLICQLQQTGDDWDSWTEGVFGSVRRDDKLGETSYLTVRNCAAAWSGWSLQIEHDSDETAYVTFSVPASIGTAQSPDPSRLDRASWLLQRSYDAFGKRVNRILSTLRYLQALGVRSAQEYKHRCRRTGWRAEPAWRFVTCCCTLKSTPTCLPPIPSSRTSGDAPTTPT